MRTLFEVVLIGAVIYLLYQLAHGGTVAGSSGGTSSGLSFLENPGSPSSGSMTESGLPTAANISTAKGTGSCGCGCGG